MNKFGLKSDKIPQDEIDICIRYILRIYPDLSVKNVFVGYFKDPSVNKKELRKYTYSLFIKEHNKNIILQELGCNRRATFNIEHTIQRYRDWQKEIGVL